MRLQHLIVDGFVQSFGDEFLAKGPFAPFVVPQSPRSLRSRNETVAGKYYSIVRRRRTVVPPMEFTLGRHPVILSVVCRIPTTDHRNLHRPSSNRVDIDQTESGTVLENFCVHRMTISPYVPQCTLGAAGFKGIMLRCGDFPGGN